MKNRIWVGKNKDGEQFTCTEKMTFGTDGKSKEYFCNSKNEKWNILVDIEFNCDYTDFFGLNLKNGEIVEITIDTETQKYEVKRPREIGWYLTVWKLQDTRAVARYWNGSVFHANRQDRLCEPMHSHEITVLYKLPDNEYLKSLE